MTDEEKAMTNFKNNFCSSCEDKEDCNLPILDCAFYDTIYKQAYLDGLAEGRNDSLDILICEQEHTQMVEKENAELKAKLNGALDICNIPEFMISNLEEKYNKSNELCSKQALKIAELEEENTELKARIKLFLKIMTN